MDVENSFDSDTSETWSLLDINDTENAHEPDVGIDASTLILKCESNTVTSCTDEAEVTVQNLNGLNEAVPLNRHSKDHPDFQVLYQGKGFQNLEENSSNINISKSSLNDDNVQTGNKSEFDNDSDCISVISESECNDIKLCTCESDKIWEVKLSNSDAPSKTEPNVLKRKWKRLKLNCRGSSGDCVNSDVVIPNGNYDAKVQNVEVKETSNETEGDNFHGAPVYRHYRNNVANTVLSLAMGVIFTGVACIAVGHFLGVHDAEHTAGEMMQTLKRLQMENVLLHTRLTQLSRAFFNRGNNKLDLITQSEPKSCLNNYVGVHETANVNDPKNNDRVKRSTQVGDISTDFTNGYKDRKRFWKRNSKSCALDSAKEECLAVRERDLGKFRWLFTERDSKKKTDELILCKFPQPENYYKGDKRLDVNDNDVSRKSYDNLKFVPKITDFSYAGNSTVEKKNNKNDSFSKPKKNDKKNRTNRAGEAEKKAKAASKIIDDEKTRKKYKSDSQKNRKITECKKKDKECLNGDKKAKKVKGKRKGDTERDGDRIKNGKDKKIRKKKDKFAPNLMKGDWKRFKGDRYGNGTRCEECAKRSQSWFQKWADGRENHRKNQKISDWQFARATSRAFSRTGDASWQFNRALGRENTRNVRYLYFRKKNSKYTIEKGFPSDAYSWI